MEESKPPLTQENSSESIFKKNVSKLKIAIIRTFTGHSKGTWIWIGIFFLILIISVIVLILQSQDETWLFDKVIRWFVGPILSLELLGPFIFIIFMGIQGIIVPIPSELVLLSSGLIWGMIGGSIIGIIGSMTAGITTYYIAMYGGRPIIEKFLGEENLLIVDKYLDRYGIWAIVFARAFPFMAFDPISYASGFLKIKLRDYLLATFFGSIIRCTFYAWLGSNLVTQTDISEWLRDPAKYQSFINQYSANFNLVLFLLIVVLGLAFVVYQFLLFPYLKKKSHE
ncbi:TVP38/TMEM64 family protein [Candidatus Hodarchaeum mangrovi]